MPRGFPGGASNKEPACQCRRRKRCGFDPWVGKIPWRKEWQPTPVFLPGESHAQRSLGDYSPLGCKELDTTEATTHTCTRVFSRVKCPTSLRGWETSQNNSDDPWRLNSTETNNDCKRWKPQESDCWRVTETARVGPGTEEAGSHLACGLGRMAFSLRGEHNRGCIPERVKITSQNL